MVPTITYINDCTFVCPQTSAQQALTGTINSSMHAVQAAQASLDDFDTLPPLGTDAVRFNSPLFSDQIGLIWVLAWCEHWAVHSRSVSPDGFFSLFKASQAWRKNKMDESKHEIHSQVDAITAGTASMVNLTAGRNTMFTRDTSDEEKMICQFPRENMLVILKRTCSPCCSDVEKYCTVC